MKATSYVVVVRYEGYKTAAYGPYDNEYRAKEDAKRLVAYMPEPTWKPTMAEVVPFFHPTAATLY